jgi:hypothetical protein
VRIIDPENCLIGFFKNSENRDDSQNEKTFLGKKKPGQFSDPAPKNGTEGSHTKVRTAQQQL